MEQTRLKLHNADNIVEIDISKKKLYENRVELGIMLRTHTLANNEEDSELLAEEVVHRLVGIIEEKLSSGAYGMEITNWNVVVHDTEIAEEE